MLLAVFVVFFVAVDVVFTGVSWHKRAVDSSANGGLDDLLVLSLYTSMVRTEEPPTLELYVLPGNSVSKRQAFVSR